MRPAIALGSISDLLNGFDAPMRALGELRTAAEDAGCSYAAVFIEGARGALRRAFAAAAKYDPLPVATVEDGDILLLGVENIAVRVRQGTPLVERGRIVEDRTSSSFLIDPNADAVPAGQTPGLVHDLLGDPSITELCSRPAFAGLLAAALGHHRWMHLGSGRMESLDPPFAKCAVSLLSGGGNFPSWPTRWAGRILDVQVCEQLARLGWRRVVSPGPSIFSMERSCEDLELYGEV